MTLKKIIIDINELNKNDSINEFVRNTDFSCYVLPSAASTYIESCAISECAVSEFDAFVITDNRNGANFARENNLGMAVYTNGKNNPAEYTNALYCIDCLKEMSDDTLTRMYQRANAIPWNITDTKRCLIREITTEDVLRLYEIYSDKETKQYIEDLYENTEDEIKYTEEYIANQYRFFEYGLWIVIDKETNVIIGRAGLFNRENQDEIELGFVFDKAYWGKGYATEVLTAIINYAKIELSVTSICANVHKDNIRSKRLLEKLSFEYNCENVIDSKAYDKYVLNY